MILIYGKKCLKCGSKKERRVNEGANDFARRKFCSAECANLSRSQQGLGRHPLAERQMTSAEVEEFLDRTEKSYWNFISPCDRSKGYR